MHSALSLIDKYFIKKPVIRRLITRVLAGNRILPTVLLGREYLLHTVREHGYLRAAKLSRMCAFLRDETPILIHLGAILADGDTFLDIGANIGIYAATAGGLRSIYPGLRVYAFEANADTAVRLRANTKSLGVEVFECALSDRNGNLEFVGGADSKVFTTVENASSYSIRKERIVCESRRLDELPIIGSSLVMKIDVEGQEWEVLRGASSFFDSDRVKAVYLDGFKDLRVREFLERYSFSFFNGRTMCPAGSDTRQLLALKIDIGSLSDS